MFKFKKVFTIVLACGALLPSASYAVKNNQSSSSDTSVSSNENHRQIDAVEYLKKRFKEINLVFACMNEQCKLKAEYQQAITYKNNSIRIMESGVTSENFMVLQTNISICEKALSNLISSDGKGINKRYTQTIRGIAYINAIGNVMARAF